MGLFCERLPDETGSGNPFPGEEMPSVNNLYCIRLKSSFPEQTPLTDMGIPPHPDIVLLDFHSVGWVWDGRQEAASLHGGLGYKCVVGIHVSYIIFN